MGVPVTRRWLAMLVVAVALLSIPNRRDLEAESRHRFALVVVVPNLLTLSDGIPTARDQATAGLTRYVPA